ncbi:MAG: sulfatase-like hydrolase/transferase [Verrucomicrobia bacterium]|nr:sulfatase-like hydrolase/transferase [Verrucomicrobiota bacterium]
MSKRRQPNLLLVWTDQQRADTLACYGNDQVIAPNLDRLASRSFVFRDAYCVQPVCTPSRGSILTGLWPRQHGASGNDLPLRAEAMTIAEWVGHEYRRAYYGKWHLGDEIVPQHGFTEWAAIEDAIYRPYYSKPACLEQFSPYHHFLVRSGYPPDARAADGARCFSREFSAALAPPFTKAHFLGRAAARFLREHDGSRPFLLSVNFLEPHSPFFGPYNDRYDPDLLSVGPAFARSPPDSASVRHRALSALYRRDGFGLPLRTERDWRRLRANYYGLVTLVDDAVGMILDALGQSGMADQTIVVFTSDHGEMMGDHALITKGVCYEEAVRIPCLIHVPWLGDHSQLIHGRVSQIDLLPTLLDLMGQPVPKCLSGVSRVGVLEGRQTLDQNDVFFLWQGREYRCPPDLDGFTREELESVGNASWRSIVSADGWKLNLCAADRCELYDLTADPHETRNRFEDRSQQNRVRDLAARIRQWQRQVGDQCPLPPV